jgi:ABC-type nitrate/sulfonate/bicarbonate transport system substrate-binding protein
MMNAVHDLPLVVAREEGFFRDEGLDVEILKTPGTAQRAADHQAHRANIFERLWNRSTNRASATSFGCANGESGSAP